jgi:hypothetical protein
MLNTETPDTDGKPAEASRPQSAPAPLPRLCSIKRACVEWGDCGKTRFYEIANKYGVELLKIGSKTVVTGEDVNKVANEIIAAARQATIDAEALAEKSKALAKRSVAARRERRGSAPAASPSATAARRRRRGCPAA